MNDFQVLYGFCVIFIASMLMLVAYWEGFGDVELFYDQEDPSLDDE